MGDLTKRQEQILTFLLADYNAIKAEIVRRSNLQRIVLVLYLTAMVGVFKYAVESRLSPWWLFGIAVVLLALVTWIFYKREGMEIVRLGGLVRESIAKTAGEILTTDSKRLLPSETIIDFSDEDSQQKKSRSKCLDSCFLILIFIGIPIFNIFISVFYEYLSKK